MVTSFEFMAFVDTVAKKGRHVRVPIKEADHSLAMELS